MYSRQRRVHTKHDRGEAFIEFTPYDDQLVMVAKVGGKFINMTDILQYNVFISDADLPMIEKVFVTLNLPRDLVIMDKIISIYLHNVKILSYYIFLANYVLDNIDDIRDQIMRRRIDLNDRYKELCSSGFKYTIAKIISCKELINLYHY
jgi:hypothetical protein